MVYLKMEIGPLYEIRMVNLKFDKWSSVCLIKCVWLNIFQHFGLTYELIHAYGLFGTEEYSSGPSFQGASIKTLSNVCNYRRLTQFGQG